MRALLLLVLLAACSTVEAPPADLLDRTVFKRLLLRSHLVEARISQERVIEHRPDSRSEAYYAELFKDEGVTREQFDRTFRWYADHPADMRTLYEEVLTELDSMQARGEPVELPSTTPADTTAQPR
jgi:hypothetical protein